MRRERWPVSTRAALNARGRLDRAVLWGNLVSGGFWIALLGLLTSWVLALIGAAYVIAASLFLSAVYGRDSVSFRQEVTAWTAPWVAAVALWTVIAALIGGNDSSGGSAYVLPVWFGLILGSSCYLAWQLSALIVRQLMFSTRRPTAPR